MPTKKTTGDVKDFVMGFIAASDKKRRQHVERWREVEANFIVQPEFDSSETSSSPYRYGGRHLDRNRRIQSKQHILKDPETHQIIMTYASNLVRVLLGDRNGEMISTRPRGYEDAVKSKTVTRLLRYAFGLQGHFRTFVEAIVDMLLFGTSVIEVTWKYEEREQLVRRVSMELGISTDEVIRQRIPVYDDVCLLPVDLVNFYPDPSRYRIQDMMGAAKRFDITALEAMTKARSGIYEMDSVQRAIANSGKHGSDNPDKSNFRRGLSQPQDTGGYEDLRNMIGYEYWGDMPWSDDQGSSRRVVTILNNEVVRDEPWPLADSALPFHSLIINPMQGRFYGISPAEVVRYKQDFADAMLMLLAEAVVRQVHPPIAYDPDADVDLSKLQAWRPDALISSRGGPSSVGTIRYDANVANGFAMLSGIKQSMREASGALGALQGQEGPDRESASVGIQRIQQAMGRPDLAAMILERDCFPPIGEAVLRRYQQFIDFEGLHARIGDLPESAWIGDIMGDFDVEFIGSRVAISRQEKLQSYDRLTSMAQVIPQLLVRVDWQKIGEDIVGDLLQLPEVAASMGSPEMAVDNALVQQVMGGMGGAGKNGVAQAAEPAGMSPAQVGGGAIP